MPNYVDGFVIVLPKKNLAEYKKIAKIAGKVWKEHGALQYVETAGDDLAVKFGLPFTKLANVKKNETVVFSWILYKSKSARNKINAKVMKDPRLTCMDKKMPFEMNRMAYGGFTVLVQ